jgi:two-component system, OmpR family, sensor histidine kinase PrrB
VIRPLSVRARVTIAATAAVALVLIGGSVATVATFAQRERSSLDRELERRAQGPARRAAILLAPGPAPESAPRPVPAPPVGLDPKGGGGLLAESGSFVRAVRGGEVVAAVGDVPEQGFPSPTKLGFATIEAGGRTWRTLAIEPPIPPQGAPRELSGTRVQFAADLEPVEDRIGAMRTRVAVISGIGIVSAAILASLLSGLALDPLSRLRKAVTGISGTRDLSRRLPESGAAEELNELARSVNAMLTRLERSTVETEAALDVTRRFAADVGHEVRTPLTSMRANLDALRRNPSMPEAERRAILEDVVREQAALVSLLDALQALARGDAAASLPREPLDLAEIVDAAVEAARRRHPGARIELSAPDERQELSGWPDGLRMLVDNLIENAVRHGGLQVTVELRQQKENKAGFCLGAKSGSSEGAVVVLSVSDDGPGVPVAERERIFERFARGEGAAASGSGLGLALVAQQASLHGGRVDVGSSSAGGARFTVRLPVAPGA